MLFCVPDIAILFISLLSCKHANFVIKGNFNWVTLTLPSHPFQGLKNVAESPSGFRKYEDKATS